MPVFGQQRLLPFHFFPFYRSVLSRLRTPANYGRPGTLKLQNRRRRVKSAGEEESVAVQDWL